MGIPLRSLLVIPFVIQILGVTSVIGYFSYRSTRQVVAELATQRLDETGDLIAQNLDQYLLTAANQNQAHLAALTAEIISLDDLDQLHRYLTLELLTTENVTTFLVGTEAGDLRTSHRVTPQDYGGNTRLAPSEIPIEAGVLDPARSPNLDVYGVDQFGNLSRYLQSIGKFETKTRSWYRLAAETGRPGWSEIFQIGSTDHLAISAFTPIYVEAQQLAGVFAVNVSLRQLDDFLANLAFAESGQAFIMQADGLMVANSTTDPTYLAVQRSPQAPAETSPPLAIPQQVEFQRLTAAQSDNPVTRAAFEAMQVHMDPDIASTDSLTDSLDFAMRVEGDRYYTHASPYCHDCGLDWVIVTTVPESALTGSLWDTVRPTILWSGLTLLAAIGAGVWLTRRMTQPLQQLNDATQAYANEQAAVGTQPTLIKEVESLRLAFLGMMAKTDAQKQAIKQFHADYERSLEADIAQRTAELNQKTSQLWEAQRIAQVGSWEFDVASQQLIWSAEMYRIVGRDPALGPPASDETFDLVVSPGDEQLRAAVAETLSTGAPYQVEQTIIRPNGEQRYIVNRGEAQRDEPGNIVRLVGTTADITDHKIAELALAASEEKRRLALELTNTGSWEFDIATGQATWSDSHYRLMGLAPNSVPANYEVWRDRVHPHDLAAAETAFQTAIDAQTLLSVEYRVVHPDGQVRWVLTQGQAIYTADGSPQRMVGVMLDISDRKQLELALQASELQLSSVLDSARAAILRIRLLPDYRFKFDYVSQNCEQLYGFSAEALMADPSLWQGCIEPEDWQAVILPMLQALQPQASPPQSFVRTYRYRYPQGALRYVLGHVSVRWHAAAQCWDGTIVDIDITELKLTEQTLQLLSQELQVWRDRYEIATNAGRQVVFEYDFIRQKYTFSPNATEIFGYALADLPQTLADSFARVHPDDVQQLREAMNTTPPSDQSSYCVEMRLLCQDGTYLWVEDQAIVHRNDSGQPIKIIGSLRDISDRKQAEQALALSEAKYRGIYDQVAMGIGYSDFDGYILGCNQKLLDMLAYQAKDLIGKHILAVTHPDDQELQTTFLQQLKHGEIDSYTFEKRYLCGDGRVIWGHVTMSIFRAPDHTPLQTIAIIQDVSDRKQAEAERDTLMDQLRQSGEHYLAILQHQTEFIARFRPDGSILFVNNAFCAYYGVERESIYGKPYQPLIYPEDQPAIDECLTKLSPEHPYSTVENRVFVRGEVRWMQWTNRAIYDDQNQLIELQAVGRDIHDRKQAESALQASQAQYQRLVDDIGDRFVVFSHTGELGVITYVSDGVPSVFGRQRADVIGKTWQQAINWSPKSVALALTELQALLHEPIDFQEFEMEFTHPDGGRRTVRVSQHPVREANGQLLAIEGIVEDISDDKQAEMELQLLNAQLEELATTDSLTKVANRRQFLTVLAQEWARHQREGLPLTLMMLDIDHFKAYNDTYGHPAGDRCLAQIAQVLKQSMQRSGDLVARYGGEEFIMLLPNTHQAGAVAIAQRLQTQLAQQAIPHQASPTDPHITVSLGIVIVQMPTDMNDTAAIAIADEMLYVAKRQRNTYHLKVVR